MPLYSSNYLKSLSRSSSESLLESARSSSSSLTTSFDIFLSHSFLDKEEVRGLFLELKSLGYSVYVDWIIDPHLDRSNVTKDTAEHIRARLKASKSLLLAISTNAAMSKWMPWELGYVDGHTSKCAIIPVAKDSSTTTFHRQEYLSLYPFIKKLPDTNSIQKLWVIDEAYKYVDFNSWKLYDTKPYSQNANIYNL